LHTLRSRQDTLVAISAPTHYSADFTGKRADEPAGDPCAPPSPGSGHRLVGGNLNDDPYIDILDFGTWAGQYNAIYPSGGPPSGNTTCGQYALNADISGDGHVDTGDFGFIAINFLMFREDNCCMQPNFATRPDGSRQAGPIMSISVAELRRRGLGHMEA